MITNLLLIIIGAANSLLNLAIIIDAILSWVPYSDNIYKIRQVLGAFINPVMRPIRKFISPLTFRIGIDISPIIAIFLIDFVANVLSKIVMVLL